VHVISRKALVEFSVKHAKAKGPTSSWYKVVRNAEFRDFAGVRETFNSADRVKQFVIFDVGAGYRIVTAIHFNRGKVYIRHVFTHPEYERWSKRLRAGK
jgi:mRNA interferase HigB